MSYRLLMQTFSVIQWRKSVKIIGGDETEPSKVAHIKKRIVACRRGNLENTVFIEIESNSSAKIGNSNVFSAQKQVVSKKKTKKKIRSSSKWSQVLRPKSEILTFFLPKNMWSPKQKTKTKTKKTKKKVFIEMESDSSAKILR